MGRQRVEILHRDLLKEREGKRGEELEQRSEEQFSEDRWGNRQPRTFKGIHFRNTSLKTDGETHSRDPT